MVKTRVISRTTYIFNGVSVPFSEKWKFYEKMEEEAIQAVYADRVMSMKKYLQLFRVKHYIKNLLIFMPIFFGGTFFVPKKILVTFSGFISFCLISSAVYIMNDMCDYEKDRKHPVKCNRPLASGKVSFRAAGIGLAVCLIISLAISFLIRIYACVFLLLLYFGLNIAYSMGLKKVPIIDVVILASGFVIRIFFGGFVSETGISEWLYLVIIVGSLYLGLGKRRNELRKHTGTRDVLRYYTDSFLDKNMYVCVALADVFYALWTIEMPNSGMIWTVPIFIIILMCYSMDIERDIDGDPTDVILHDKILLCLVALFAAILFMLLYI